ncbi:MULTISPECIES: hypothetical protein [unclassified Streptomyces]|uniref:hypothetical protein n=1 Tax=unclassified Streptomyces TaxID=2593676 RepID=UPI002DD94E83|nr:MULTISPECIES: hypothetical protein [unclassified Streptomyces]WSA95121.1 hypothetical protein OIE63_28880 [Streptomyces sp. NBC_01795]WSB79542.1 hypothetical protein OHB04_29995 [Streptomyces sp. NBC_01775]WSS12254.1 hypothetical protein OG533_10220 [Streptomyces sp. NBC_01186]WSS40967.1 hypothetical protein OG220_10375 [Streptomyces sp. NBC_01187]
MDAVQVAALREALAGSEWLRDTRRFGGALRSSVGAHGGGTSRPKAGGGLLVVGTATYEPWHLAAHLDDEAAWSGMPELAPTLVRHAVPRSAPAHLSVGLGRIEAARRGETLLVVSGARGTGGALLTRLHDARRAGATVFALASAGAGPELDQLAHESLTADAGEGLDLEVVQHLVSAAAGETYTPRRAGGRFRDRLSRLADLLTAPPPPTW